VKLKLLGEAVKQLCEARAKAIPNRT